MPTSQPLLLAGIDLAWQSERNPSAVAFASLYDDSLCLTSLHPAVRRIRDVLAILTETVDLKGVAIDAPLIINNQTGQRPCESGIGTEYGSRYASCHTSNLTLYPEPMSVFLADELERQHFKHLKGDKWQIECYPHPAIIEVFGLDLRLPYKKGRVSEKREGQKKLANFLRSLENSHVLRLAIDAENAHYLDEDRIAELSGQRLKSNEDALDAIMCVYIAGLYEKGVAGKVFGDESSGYIWVPQTNCT